MIDILMVSVLGLESITDIRKRTCNLYVIAFGTILGGIFNYFFLHNDILWLCRGVVPGVILICVSLISKQQIGMGDAMVFLFAGICVGLYKCLILLWISLVFAGIFGVIFCLAKKKEMKYRLPFIPFVAVGYAVLYIFGWLSGG